MNILIADDDATNRTILLKFLEKWGYTVTVATDGAQAWEILQEPGAPNIALLDWMMPGIDGVEVCRRLRTLRSMPYTYLILLSAKFQKQEILDGLDAGADDYITKPFSPNELAARLRSGCRIVELQDELVLAREALQLQVSRDPTTGLWSRTAILEFVESEIAFARREHSCVGVLLADADHFKNVNDTHGHLVGDEVLREVGTRFTQCLRPYDAAGRYGGDEFLIVARTPTIEHLAMLAERLRATLAVPEMATRLGSVPVTVSIGYALWDFAEPLDRQTLLVQVDEALYRAKHLGRNCCAPAQANRAAREVPA